MNVDVKGMVTSIPVEEQEIIKEVWYMFDIDKNGTIERDEFCQVLKELNINPGPEDMAEIFKELDNNSTGVIDYDEFLEFMIKRLQSLNNNADELDNMFKCFDPTNKGFFGVTELKDVTEHLGCKFDEENLS